MTPRAWLHQSRPRRQDGFSLAEMIIAVALMVIVTTGSLLAFNISIRQNNQSRNKQEEQSAISADLATVQTMNDRYTCTTATAASSECSISDHDPNEDEYYADVTAPSDASDRVDEACADGTLIEALINSINALALPEAFARLGISRNAAASSDANGRSPLRYTVTWSKNSGSIRLRQITLVPTVANWCP